MTRIDQKLTDYENVEDALTDLCSGLCLSEVACRHCEVVQASEVPIPFAELLVHGEHMTSRLRDHHGQPVALRVLDEIHEEPFYRRKIVLTLGGTEQVVEFGVVRIDFRFTPPEARAAILQQQVPLGDILMSCSALRRIEPRWYVKMSGQCPIFAGFCAADKFSEVYGRVGTIYCDDQPAVELFEVITAVRGSSSGDAGGASGG